MKPAEFLSLFREKQIFVVLNSEETLPAYFGSYERFENRLTRDNENGYSVYFTVNDFRPGVKRTKDKFLKAKAVWIDDDGDKNGVTDPKSFPIQPNVILSTSPGKFQYIWLTECEDMDEWQAVINGMNDKYNGDPKAGLVSQVLRVPGFVNTKYSEKPLVTAELVDDAVHSWDIIKKHFPPNYNATAYDMSVNSTTKKFSVKEAIEDILSGESIHDSRIRLAMHWANSGMPKQDALDTLNGYVEDAIRSNTVDKGRAMERLGNMKQAVETAYQKVEEEQEQKFEEPDHVGTLDVYTRLPECPGALGIIAQSVMDYMPYPSYEMAMVVAQHCVSVFGGGLFHIKNKTTTRKRTILADTGRGKSVVDKYYNEVIRLISLHNDMVNPYVFNGSNSYSVSNMHVELLEHRVRSFLISEAGLMGKSTAGTTTEIRAYILNAISSSRKSAISAKQLSNRTGDNRKMNESLKTLYGVVPVFLSESVPAQYIDVLTSTDAFRSGDIGREEIIFVDPIKPAPNYDAEGDIDERVVDAMTLLVKSFENKGFVTGDDPMNPDKFAEVDTSDIDHLYFEMREQNVAASNEASKDHDFVRQAMLSRLPEKVLVTILVQAIADACWNRAELGKPKATVEHFEYAMRYHEALTRSMLAQTNGGALADALTLCIERVIHFCKSYGSRAKDKQLAHEFGRKIVGKSWLTFVLDRAKFKAVANLISEKNGSRDSAMREIINYCEDINLLVPMPPAAGGRKPIWRINV